MQQQDKGTNTFLSAQMSEGMHVCMWTCCSLNEFESALISSPISHLISLKKGLCLYPRVEMFWGVKNVIAFAISACGLRKFPTFKDIILHTCSANQNKQPRSRNKSKKPTQSADLSSIQEPSTRRLRWAARQPSVGEGRKVQ